MEPHPHPPHTTSLPPPSPPPYSVQTPILSAMTLYKCLSVAYLHRTSPRFHIQVSFLAGVYLSIYLSIYLSVCLSVDPVRLSVCLVHGYLQCRIRILKFISYVLVMID